MTKIVKSVVRSGQQIYGDGEDVVVLAAVQSGAEVIADGCVHIYAPCFGRVMAGANGDRDAMIFCAHFEPELVAIGNRYVTAEEVPAKAWGNGVKVYREGGVLRVEDLVMSFGKPAAHPKRRKTPAAIRRVRRRDRRARAQTSV